METIIEEEILLASIVEKVITVPNIARNHWHDVVNVGIHLDRFCDAINGRRNNNNPPPQRNNNNYNNGLQQQRPPPNHYGNRPSPQAGRGPPLPYRRPNINARLTNVGSISDEYSTSEPLQQQYDQNTGYYPPEI